MADPYDYDSDTSLQTLLNSLFNPYQNDVLLAYGYQPSPGTPSITNPGDYIDPDPGGNVPLPPPGGYTPPPVIPPIDPGPDPEPPPPPPPPNPCPAGYVMGPDGVCIIDPGPEPPPQEPPPPPPPPPPPGPPTGYVNAATMADYDPFMHGRRNKFYGMEVLAGSRQEVSADEFNRLLGGTEGKYGQGAFYDPERGSIYQNIDDDKVFVENSSYVPYGIDPDKYQPQQKTQAAMFGFGDQKDDRGRSKRSQNPIYTSQRIGDKMYFVDDGKVYSYDIRDKEGTVTFAAGGPVSSVARNGIGALFAKEVMR